MKYSSPDGKLAAVALLLNVDNSESNRYTRTSVLRRADFKVIECMGRELHDELGQSLTALKLDLDWLVQAIPQKKKVRARAATMHELINPRAERGKSSRLIARSFCRVPRGNPAQF